MLRARLGLRRVSGPRIRPAVSADLPAVLALLRAAHLPEDVEPHFAAFLVAENAGAIIGAIGVERCGREALLRSLVVAPEHRGAGTGTMLAGALIRRLRGAGIGGVFLLTTDAASFFAKLGFAEIPRGDAPAEIRDTREFRELCPASAHVMRLGAAT